MRQQAPTAADTKQRRFTPPRLQALGLTCVSAAVAESVTYPIDAIKTQLQLQHGVLQRSPPLFHSNTSRMPPGGATQHSSKPRSAVQLARQLGLSGLYAGLTPAVVRHVFYTGTRITLYEQLRNIYAARQAQHHSSASSSSDSSGAASVGLGPRLLCGLTAGAVGQLVAVPADLLKVCGGVGRHVCLCDALASTPHL
jgi:solute carrier family 25 uncoupling protein 27